MLYAQPRICPGGRDSQYPLGFTNGLIKLSQATTPSNNQQKKRTC